MSIISNILRRLFGTAEPEESEWLTAAPVKATPVSAATPVSSAASFKAAPASKNGMPMWRQGDVFIRPIATIPDHARRSRVPHGILAHGELTGHSHRLEDPQAAQLFQGATTSGEFYLDVPGTGARVVHEEHGPIELPAGLYRVWRQREYSPRGSRVVGD
jgi:hypothetical protein